ncbi:hypothetical protein A3SI_15723 [Nitritalea halalkaliphila LW7]|uniref:S-adenosyl-l-methionine hydroxide adenosyltransferase C-terminal domain-containing protein n=1 Tax=Nitritalea halalkaliphila LW7 TaxID=1189621 RepID=I5BYC3_9BACT|nr:SAM hydroxide adenosyltransferase [Nitritalea halalkaliphila]EIM74575.1 hypothetical protein A3SI_15723 [Nitritalea halalkaliphila LW7]
MAQWKRLIPRQFKANRKQISGHVIYIDSYGNLITNIPKQVFDTLNPGRFSLEIGRETFHRLHSNYEETDSGECFAFFNHSGLLEIGITHGSGAELLGLKLDSPVRIHFDTE